MEKLLFIEIHKFKKKILEKHQDESNEESDAETTGNEWNGNNTFFAFLECFKKRTVPGKGYIGSKRSPTGVTDTPTGSQWTPDSINELKGLEWFKAQPSRLDYD